MKECINCHKEIKQGANFCPYCGGAQEEVVEEVIISSDSAVTEDTIVVEPTEQRQPNQAEVEETVTVESTKPITPNQAQQTNGQTEEKKVFIQVDSDKVQDITNQGKNYFSYLNNSIVKPTIGTKNKNGYFGLISYLLIALFTTLAISRSLGKAMGAMGFQSAFPMFFQIFFLMLVSQIVYVIVMLLASNAFYKTKISWLDAFDAIYTPASISVYFALASFILSFISGVSMGMLFIITLAAPPVLLGLSYMGNIWLIEDATGKKNRFYTSLLIFFIGIVIQIFVAVIFGDVITNSIMEVIDGVMNPANYMPDMFPY